MGHKFRAGLLAASFSVLLSGTSLSSAFAEDLADAIALAYETNPTILSQRSVLRNADEAFYRTRVNLGPSVSATVTASGSTDNDLINGGAGSSGATVRGSAGIDQTIYSGGRLSANLEAQRASLASARESLRSVEQRVLQQVVEAYTGVRRAEQQLVIAQEQVEILQRQRDEAQVRFEVGAGTITDVAQSDARLASSRTQLTGAQNTLANARTSYRTIVGKSPEDLDAEPSLASVLPASLGEAFNIAQQNNPALRQAYLAEYQSAAQVSAARAARRPTISVGTDVTYTMSNPSSNFGPFNNRIGSGFGNDTAGLTASATVSVPLFPGRTTASQIRSARESNRQDEIQIEAQLRSLNQTVTSAWNTLVAARAQIESQQEAVRATRLATEGTREEEAAGLRTTLDILNAEQEQRQAEQALVNAQFQEYTAAVALLNAMGTLSPGDFGANVDLYDPEEHFNQINDVWTPLESFIERIDRIGAAPIESRMPSEGEIVPDVILP